MTSETFHFLRPEWLWALAALLPVFVWIYRRQDSAGGWRKVCDPELLVHLIEGRAQRAMQWPVAAFALAATATVLALAGPTWQRLPVLAYENPTQTIAVLQLTPSMAARDTAPNRLDRARYELQDMLAAVEGSVGLVIFAEEAYAVTPLTDDPRVIGEVVPTLDPGLMPGRGHRLDRAIAEAHRLLENAGARSGRIVVFADGLGDAPGKAQAAAADASAAGYPVSALSLNSDSESLRPLVSAGGGRLSPVEPGDGDIAFLLGLGGAAADDFQSLTESGFEADTWQDAGAALLWLPLLLAPFAFRRGWAGSLGLWLVLSAVQPQPVQASVADWFSRPDQRGASAFAEGEHASAVGYFEDRGWRGVAAYRGGDLDGAIEALTPLDDARGQYNLGNSLARSGRLEEAIAAYQGVLEKEPDHADALFNQQLVTQLFEQEQNSQQDPSDGQQGQGDSPPKPGQGQGENTSPENAEQAEAAAESTGDPGESGSQASKKAESQQAGQDPAEAREQGPASSGQAQGDDESPSQNRAAHSPSGGQEGSEDSASRESREAIASGAGQVPDPAEAESSGTREEHLASEGHSEGETGEASESGEGLSSIRAPMSEEEQEIEQWLGRVPDDPGGLLREKLRRRYAEKQAGYGLRQGGSTW